MPECSSQSTGDVVAWYDASASSLAEAYEAVPSERLHSWLEGLLPREPGVVIDVGAGTGRDAAWLAGQGHDVIAVEPSARFREVAARLHPDPRIRLVEDRLPALSRVLRLGLAADLILLSGVWQHVAPVDRPRAFRKLASLLRSGGILAVTLRSGPSGLGRALHGTSAAELESLARAAGMEVVRVVPAEDAMGRPEVSWVNVALRLPDDGTGALPLLRHLILNDQKSATYKLGLLRALCRAADSSAGLAREGDEEHVSVPLGLVALNWVRLYLPLAREDLPQSPTNTSGCERLGFAGPGFRAILAGVASQLDLRVGARFAGAQGAAVHGALREAAETIEKMPASFMTLADGRPVFPVARSHRARAPAELGLDAAYLASFGEMLAPAGLWRAMRRYAAWIEPALVLEWQRLIKGYALRQGRRPDEGRMVAAMAWSDPDRDVGLPRKLAAGLLERGESLHCVWSGRLLHAAVLDIDHCLPWSAWPCGDLWNLLPAHREVNQRLKRDRLRSPQALASAEDAILGWWDRAYASGVLRTRFSDEAAASLPLPLAGAPGLAQVFSGLDMQRLRLRLDQRVPEWPAAQPARPGLPRVARRAAAQGR